jgi:hypothetical protein
MMAVSLVNDGPVTILLDSSLNEEQKKSLAAKSAKEAKAAEFEARAEANRRKKAEAEAAWREKKNIVNA